MLFFSDDRPGLRILLLLLSLTLQWTVEWDLTLNTRPTVPGLRQQRMCCNVQYATTSRHARDTDVPA